MVTVDTRAARGRGWSTHLRGHVLLFERTPAPTFTAHAGVRLLLAAALVEIVRLAVVRWLGASVPLALLTLALLGLALCVVRPVSGVTLSQLGLRRWRDWTAIERSYFVQVSVLANVVFALVLAPGLRNRTSEWALWNTFVPYVFYGFYQELVYRGMIQLALVRRWSAPVGILVANVLYTFGPLHWNYYAGPASVRLPMLAAIFAIGLFFGIVYQRSRNLWIVAVFHAIGNAYMVWGLQEMR